MPLDHAQATVTMSIAGIAISRLYKRNQYEIDLLRCDRHRPALDIEKIELDPVTRMPRRSSLIAHSLNLSEDIAIDVTYPDKDGCPRFQRGVSTYLGRRFDRLHDIGDPEDFRWVADLEGPEFHNQKLKVKNLSELKPTIFLSSGILYTRQKTDEAFARVSVKGKPSPRALGRFAHGISADIRCPVGGAVILSNRSESGLAESRACYFVSLPQSEEIQYRITLDNHCDEADESEGTDFRLFYDVLEAPEGEKFDLRRFVETGCYGVPDKALKSQGDFALDGYPQSCFTVRLGS